MRLFRIDDGKRFIEYKVQDFKSEHLEEDLEALMEVNPDSLFEDEGILILGRQVSTNFRTFLDILGLDRSGNTVIVELKRDRTPREVIAQALEYASFIESLNSQGLEHLLQLYTGNENESLSEYHKAFFELEESESISFNKDQRIVVVGSRISPEVRQQAIFLNRKGLQVSCIEFSYFQTQSGEQLLSTDVVIGKEHFKSKEITTEPLPRINRETFLESVNCNGLPVFERILNLAEEQSFPIHWGGKGFSLNIEIAGKDVALCYGYPPHAVYGQSIYTAFADIIRKIEGGGDVSLEFKEKFNKLGYFVRAGNEVKWVIVEDVLTQSIEDFVTILLELGETLRQHGIS